MSIVFKPAALRSAAALVWLLYIAWVAVYWLGLTGLGLVCVLSTRWLAALLAPGERSFQFDAASVDAVWIMPFAVAVRMGREPQWLFRDETGPAQWAAVLRTLRQLPRAQPQAVGLNISR